jgi:WD40-like Beta Propeller Repeat
LSSGETKRIADNYPGSRAGSGLSWSPNGRLILFGGWDGRTDFVATVPSSGGPKNRIATNATTPAWSPDGQKIGYTRSYGRGRSWIVVAAGDGRKPKRVTPAALDAWERPPLATRRLEAPRVVKRRWSPPARRRGGCPLRACASPTGAPPLGGPLVLVRLRRVVATVERAVARRELPARRSRRDENTRLRRADRLRMVGECEPAERVQPLELPPTGKPESVTAFGRPGILVRGYRAGRRRYALRVTRNARAGESFGIAGCLRVALGAGGSKPKEGEGPPSPSEQLWVAQCP